MSQPAHKIRISNLTAVIWRNLAERGNWYSVQLTRGYKTDDGWRNTDNLGGSSGIPGCWYRRRRFGDKLGLEDGSLRLQHRLRDARRWSTSRPSSTTPSASRRSGP
jgi:hypothetical protein